MKKIIIILILSFFHISSYADKIIIPFSCYPKKVQKRFIEYNRKLDLDPNERDEESWGFLVNHGMEYEINTYWAVTDEELTFIKKIVMEMQNENICR